jgi:TPR repeat protein
MQILVALMVALALVAAAHAQNGDRAGDAAFRKGLSAFEAGSYERARTAWEKLAKAGDARSQAGIGYMYYTGRGVPRDVARAAEHFGRAANQGEPTAQLFLAVMYFRADGVPKNLPLALMWIELAVAGGQPETFELRGSIMQAMTDAEREESWRLLARWREAHATNGARP